MDTCLCRRWALHDRSSMSVRDLATRARWVACFRARTTGGDCQAHRSESMEQPANCSLALGHDMLSRPRHVRMRAFGPRLGRESMAHKFNLLLLIWAP